MLCDSRKNVGKLKEIKQVDPRTVMYKFEKARFPVKEGDVNPSVRNPSVREVACPTNTRLGTSRRNRKNKSRRSTKKSRKNKTRRN